MLPPNDSPLYQMPPLARRRLLLWGLVCLVALQPVGCTAAEEESTSSAAKPAQSASALATKPADKASASPAKPAESEDEAAIRRSATEFAEAFNRHVANEVAALWTGDGGYVDAAGQTYHGRDAIEELYAKFFREHPDAKIEVTVDSVRRLNPMTFIEDGTAKLNTAPSGRKYVAIHVKQADGSWLLASVRESASPTPAAGKDVQRLDSLVGQWTAEHADAQVDLDGQWNEPKSFVERRYTITRDGKVVLSSLEIIGWDPVSGRITSWAFSSDGGRAKGVWTAMEDGWVIENAGVTAGGRPTTSIDVWAPLRNGALGWRSTARTVGGTPVADSKHVVLQKKEASKQAMAKNAK